MGIGGDRSPYGSDKSQRAVVVTTDPQHVPPSTMWNLLTNLPAPGSEPAATSRLAPASVEEIVRLYGLRMWVEQSYKQVKHALGWAEYHVRSDVTMRRHWALVWRAFSFCWWHPSHGAQEEPEWQASAGMADRAAREPGEAAGRGKSARSGQAAPGGMLAGSVAEGARVVSAMGDARALLASVVAVAAT